MRHPETTRLDDRWPRVAPLIAWIIAGCLLLARAIVPVGLAQSEPPELEPVWQGGGAVHAVHLRQDVEDGCLGFDFGVGPRVVSIVQCIDFPDLGYSPQLLGVVQGIDRSGERLLVATGPGGLQVLDSNLGSLALLGSLDLEGDTLDVAAFGDSAVLARGPDGLAMVDISEPGAPRVLAEMPLASGVQAMDLARVGELVLVAAGVTGLHVVDVSAAEAPVEIGHLERAEGFPVNVEAVVAGEGDAAFACDGPRVLWVDLADPSRPGLRDVLELDGGATCRALSVGGGRLEVLSVDPLNTRPRLHRYALDGGEPDLIVVMDPGLPAVPAGIFETPRPRMALASSDVDGPLVAAGGLGLRRVARGEALRGDEAWPAILGTGEFAWPEAVEVDGRRAYVAAGAGGLIVLDLGRTHEPRWVGTLPIVGHARDVVARGDEVLVAAESGGLHRVDVRASSASGWRERSHLEQLGGAGRLALGQRHVYVADALVGLRIVALEPDGGMQEVGGIDLGFDYPEGLFVDRAHNRLAVAHGSGVSLYDLADEAAPRRLWTVETPGFARDVDGIGADLLVADDQSGMTVLWSALERDTAPEPLPEGGDISTHDTLGSAQSVAAWAPARLARGLGGFAGASAPSDIGYSREAWIADGEAGLATYWLDNDFGGPEAGLEFTLPREAVDVEAEDGFIFAAARGSGLWLFHDPFFPPRPWKLNLPWLQRDGWPGGQSLRSPSRD